VNERELSDLVEKLLIQASETEQLNLATSRGLSGDLLVKHLGAWHVVLVRRAAVG
jgi:hypothetical protein